MFLAFVRRHFIYIFYKLIKESANDVTFKPDSELNWQDINAANIILEKHIRLKTGEIARKWLY